MDPSYIVTLILALRIWGGDSQEMPEHRRERLMPTAIAMSHYVRTNEELAGMLTQAEAESHFASYVLEGRCLEGPKDARCDPDRHGVPRASGPWQVWVRYCRGAQRFAEGSAERIDATARCALGMLRYGLQVCPEEGWVGAFSMMKRSRCDWKGAPERVQRMRQILAMIRGHQ